MNNKIALIILIGGTLCPPAYGTVWYYPKNTTTYSNNHWTQAQLNDYACTVDSSNLSSYTIQAGYFLVDLGSSIHDAPQYACPPIYQNCNTNFGIGKKLNLTYREFNPDIPPKVSNGNSIDWSDKCYMSEDDCRSYRGTFLYDDTDTYAETLGIATKDPDTGETPKYGECLSSTSKTGECKDLPGIQQCQTTWHDDNVPNTIYGDIKGQYTASESSGTVTYDADKCTCTVTIDNNTTEEFQGWDPVNKYWKYKITDCTSNNPTQTNCSNKGAYPRLTGEIKYKCNPSNNAVSDLSCPNKEHDSNTCICKAFYVSMGTGTYANSAVFTDLTFDDSANIIWATQYYNNITCSDGDGFYYNGSGTYTSNCCVGDNCTNTDNLNTYIYDQDCQDITECSSDLTYCKQIEQGYYIPTYTDWPEYTCKNVKEGTTSVTFNLPNNLPCPIGSTTDRDGAGKNRQACHLTGDTVFEDTKGSFSISDQNATATDNTK